MLNSKLWQLALPLPFALFSFLTSNQCMGEGFKGRSDMASRQRTPSVPTAMPRPEMRNPAISRPAPRPSSSGLKPLPPSRVPGNAQLPSRDVHSPGGAQLPKSPKPSSRPAPNLGGRPIPSPALPPTMPSRPTGPTGSVRPSNPGMVRPLPSRPTVPSIPTRPERPALPERPDSIVRPKPGDDLLGTWPKPRPRPNRPPVAPERPQPRPERPDFNPSRPQTRPNRPPSTRPTPKPGWNNNTIHLRPSWVHINQNQWNSLHQNLHVQVPHLHGWHLQHSDRMADWNRWGSQVRSHWWHHHGPHHDWFTPQWWQMHQHGHNYWNFYHQYYSYPSSYWWTRPTFSSFPTWFTWTVPTDVWSEPFYYAYGPGGNVNFVNGNVVINGVPVATTQQFAESAAVLATVAPPESDEAAEDAQWMPLGTFALSTDRNELEPTRILQLAVSQDGIVSGSLYNTITDSTQAVQGSVDPDTQRVAFRIGLNGRAVVETGLYNLTQDETPVLVHFGAERSETYLLVRLEEPTRQTRGTTPDERLDELFGPRR